MHIAYVGAGHGTSLHRADALHRLGHQVSILDPRAMLRRPRWMGQWLYHSGGLGAELLIKRRLLAQVQACASDLIWVDQGELLGPGLLGRLRAFRVPIVNYVIDDPFGGRDGLRFRAYRKALPYYDLVAVVRQENVAEARSAGAPRVLRVWMTADELAHAPRTLTPHQQNHFKSDVSFIGTWMPERGPFLLELIRNAIPLSIWGNRWDRAPEWPVLRRHWRGPAVDGDEYVSAILASKICLGMLSKGNRDLHTTRSLEIPAIGGLLCAERTSEHLELYRDGEEAVFWSSALECAEQCRALLADDARRSQIARRGYIRAQQNGYFNERVMADILRAAASAEALK